MRKVTEQQFSIGRGLAYLAGFGGLRTDFRRYAGSLPRAFVLVSNHQSLADVVFLPLVVPGHHLRFVAKSQLKYGVPYVSVALRMGRHAVISRTSDYRAGRRAMVKLADLSADGICPTVFPEGNEVAHRRGPGFPKRRVPHHPGTVPPARPFRGRRRRLPDFRSGPDPDKNERDVVQDTASDPVPCPSGKKEILDLLARIQIEITEQVRQWRAGGA